MISHRQLTSSASPDSSSDTAAAATTNAPTSGNSPLTTSPTPTSTSAPSSSPQSPANTATPSPTSASMASQSPAASSASGSPASNQVTTTTTTSPQQSTTTTTTSQAGGTTTTTSQGASTTTTTTSPSQVVTTTSTPVSTDVSTAVVTRSGSTVTTKVGTTVVSHLTTTAPVTTQEVTFTSQAATTQIVTSTDPQGSVVTAAQTTLVEVTAVQTQVETLVASSTLASTVVIVTTNVAGQTITSTPSFIPTTIVTTEGNGQVSTMTSLLANPTVNGNDPGNGGTKFFSNPGAVAGTFAGIGIALIVGLLFLFFCLRRRRRTRQLEHDTAVQATLAAAGYGRSPLFEDEDDRDTSEDPEKGHRTRTLASSQELDMAQRASVLGGVAAASAGYGSTASRGRYQDVSYSTLPMPSTTPHTPGAESGPGGFFTGYQTEPFIPPGTHERQPLMDGAGVSGPQHTPTTSASSGNWHQGHASTPSGGSYDPLLAGYASHPPRDTSAPASPATPSPGASSPLAPSPGPHIAPSPTPPPRNPQRAIDAASRPSVDSASQRPEVMGNVPAAQRSSASVYSNDETDPRMDYGRQHSDLRDDQDYSRRLEIRNMPDNATSVSHEST